VDVPAKRTVKFKMGRLMKERMISGTRESAGTK
jgi:nucleoid DNA-binding protein